MNVRMAKQLSSTARSGFRSTGRGAQGPPPGEERAPVKPHSITPTSRPEPALQRPALIALTIFSGE
jgi:hypothetical protein